MRLSLCNEVVREMPFKEQCAFASALGYDGLELAPFTLTDDPATISAKQAAELRATAEGEGVAITGLHWLLLVPPGLSITTMDNALWERTRQHLLHLVRFCAELGGSVLVHGSPAQRRIEPGAGRQRAYDRARTLFSSLADAAVEYGVIYCLEPLSTKETDFINRVEEAVAMVDEVDSPGFRTMLDTSAAGQSERQPVAEVIRRWMPSGKLAHVQFNDTNRRGPGQGDDDFLPILQALRDTDYSGIIAMEPFIYEPDGPATAEYCIRHVRTLLEKLV